MGGKSGPRTKVRIFRSGFLLKIRTSGPDFPGPWAGQGPNRVFGHKRKSDQVRIFPDQGPDFSGPWAGQGPNRGFGQIQKSDQGPDFSRPRSEVRIRKDEGPDLQGPDFHKVRIPADEVRILCVAFSVLRNPVIGAGNPDLGSGNPDLRSGF